MAAIIDYITAPFSMLEDAIDAFRPVRPAKPAPTPKYGMAQIKRHQGLEEAMRSFYESIRRLESTMDCFEQKVDDLLAIWEQTAEQQKPAQCPPYSP